MRKIVLLLFLVISSAFTLVILPQQTSAASKLVFQDDFNDGNYDGWEIYNNTCVYNGRIAEWVIEEGRIGMKTNDKKQCYSFLTPDNTLWDTTSNDYIVEFDMTLARGTDHMIAFRFENITEWNDFHIQSPERLILGTSGSVHYGDYSNGQTMHFKLIIQGRHLQIYRDNVLIIDNPHVDSEYSTGRFALLTYAGEDVVSETWFDNVIVTEISDEPNLNVPLIKQDDPLWKTEVYDSANLWYPADPSIARWGCALTSTVMVLKHYGIDKLPNNSLLTPKSLNEWMKQQPTGYMNGGNFNWYVIPKLVEQLQANDMIPNFKNNSLEYHFDKSPNRIQQLSKDLENNIPGILQVILNPVTNDSHFVVAKGIQDDTFILNDPLWERTLLTDTYNNDFYRLNRFVPSDSDLSYLVLETSQNIEISVTDSNGNAIGDHYLQEPITDPYNLSIDMGDPYKIYVIQKPETENYTIEVSSNENNNYVFNAYLYDKNANDKKITLEGFTSTSPDLYTINFNKDAVDESHSQKTVTFQSTIDDVNEAVALKLMNKGLGKSIIALLKSAEKDLQKNKKHSSVSAGKKLDGIEKMLDRFQRKKNLLTEEAYQILKYDIEVLKVTLK